MANVADVSAQNQNQDQDEDKRNENEDDDGEEAEETEEDEEVDESPFPPEEWPEQIRRIEEMTRIYDAIPGRQKNPAPDMNGQHEDELGLPIVKNDEDVDMED